MSYIMLVTFFSEEGSSRLHVCFHLTLNLARTHTWNMKIVPLSIHPSIQPASQLAIYPSFNHLCNIFTECLPCARECMTTKASKRQPLLLGSCPSSRGCRPLCKVEYVGGPIFGVEQRYKRRNGQNYLGTAEGKISQRSHKRWHRTKVQSVEWLDYEAWRRRNMVEHSWGTFIRTGKEGRPRPKPRESHSGALGVEGDLEEMLSSWGPFLSFLCKMCWLALHLAWQPPGWCCRSRVMDWGWALPDHTWALSPRWGLTGLGVLKGPSEYNYIALALKNDTIYRISLANFYSN